MPWPKAWAKRKGISIALAEQIPKEYQRHSKVFDEKEADRFPPKQEEDHAINLKEDAPAVLVIDLTNEDSSSDEEEL